MGLSGLIRSENLRTWSADQQWFTGDTVWIRTAADIKLVANIKMLLVEDHSKYPCNSTDMMHRITVLTPLLTLVGAARSVDQLCRISSLYAGWPGFDCIQHRISSCLLQGPEHASTYLRADKCMCMHLELDSKRIHIYLIPSEYSSK